MPSVLSVVPYTESYHRAHRAHRGGILRALCALGGAIYRELPPSTQRGHPPCPLCARWCHIPRITTEHTEHTEGASSVPSVRSVVPYTENYHRAHRGGILRALCALRGAIYRELPPSTQSTQRGHPPCPLCSRWCHIPRITTEHTEGASSVPSVLSVVPYTENYHRAHRAHRGGILRALCALGGAIYRELPPSTPSTQRGHPPCPLCARWCNTPSVRV